MASDPLIQLEAVSHTYDGIRQAVDRLNLTIQPGEIFALVGPNGAGKSTTLRMLATLQLPTSGRVCVGGYDTATHREEVRRLVGYLPDLFSLYEDLTVEQLLAFFGQCHGLTPAQIENRTDELLQRLDLSIKRYSQVAGLSRGMKQRLGIAKTLLHNPKVVILDEPASGLDPVARAQLRELLLSLREEGTTIIISSHVLSELAGLCTAVGIMEAGILQKCGPLADFMDEGFLLAQRFRLRLLSAYDKAEAVLRARSVPHRQLNSREIEVEVSGEEKLGDLIEALVLRGVRISAAAPSESQLEAIYRASARGEVA